VGVASAVALLSGAGAAAGFTAGVAMGALGGATLLAFFTLVFGAG